MVEGKHGDAPMHHKTHEQCYFWLHKNMEVHRCTMKHITIALLSNLANLNLQQKTKKKKNLVVNTQDLAIHFEKKLKLDCHDSFKLNE